MSGRNVSMGLGYKGLAAAQVLSPKGQGTGLAAPTGPGSALVNFGLSRGSRDVPVGKGLRGNHVGKCQPPNMCH